MKLVEMQFNIQRCCTNLKYSQYKGFLKKIEVYIDRGRWINKDSGALLTTILTNRLWQLLNSYKKRQQTYRLFEVYVTTTTDL